MRGCFDNLKPVRKTPEQEPPQHWYRKPPHASVGWFWTPRVASSQDYLYDLDTSERITRPKRGIDFFPVPGLQMTADQRMVWMGAVQGVMPQSYDAVIRLASQRPTNVGPKPDLNMWSDSMMPVTVPQIALG